MKWFVVATRKSLVAASVALTLCVVEAADKKFAVADGSWGTDANWSPAGVPVTGDTATIPDGKTCRVGTGVTTACVKTTVSAGGALLIEGGLMQTSDNSSSKQNLTVEGLLSMTAGSLAVHDLTINKTGKAEFPDGSLTVHNNLYNNAATTETTGLHIGANVTLAKGYWDFNAPGGVIAGLNRSLTEIRVPTNTKGTGTLLITNSNLIVDTLGVAYHLSNRNNLTGRVDIVKSDVAVKALKISDSHITEKNRREVVIGEGGTLSLTSSVGWQQADGESLRVQVGGEGVQEAQLIVTNTSKQLKSITLQSNATLAVSEGGSVKASNVYVRRNAELLVDGGALSAPIECAVGGSVKIDGGTVEEVITCASEGRVVMNGGTLRTNFLCSNNEDAEEEAYFRFDGGAQLYLQDVLVGGKNVSSHNTSDTVITPTTMEFLDCSLKCFDTYCYLSLGAKATANKARVVFDGCKMDPSNGTNYKWYLRTGPNADCEAIVRGSKNELYFQQLEGSDFRLEYVFDTTTQHIAPVHLERTGHKEAVGPAGHLYLTVPGGALLTAGASFDIITSINEMDLAQKDFTSTPWSRGDSPWTGALANGKKSYRVTLNPTAEAAPGSGWRTLGATKVAGAVSIPVGSTEKLVALEVALGVDGLTSEKAASLVAALTAAGYAAKADATSVVVSLPASAVAPNATNYFVWDFAKSDAAVSSVRVKAKEQVEKFYLHFL